MDNETMEFAYLISSVKMLISTFICCSDTDMICMPLYYNNLWIHTTEYDNCLLVSQLEQLPSDLTSTSHCLSFIPLVVGIYLWDGQRGMGKAWPNLEGTIFIQRRRAPSHKWNSIDVKSSVWWNIRRYEHIEHTRFWIPCQPCWGFCHPLNQHLRNNWNMQHSYCNRQIGAHGKTQFVTIYSV